MLLPRLPDYVPPYVPPQNQLSRPTAQSIRQITPRLREITQTLPGYNVLIPMLYGEDRISGAYLVRPYVGGGQLRFAIAWCHGEIEGVQTVYINGAAVPGGVIMTHYTGTQTQGIDPTLSGGVAGFGDRYPGVAYTVFSVPADTITDFPRVMQIEAVIRGRKVLDPRTDTFAWSQNPALCLADYISAAGVVGPGLPVFGVEDAADRCDEELGGTPRCRIGITIPQGLTLSQILDLFAVHGEFLYDYEGEGVRIVPDAPVEEVAATITLSDMVRDTFRTTAVSSLGSPTQISLTYREPTLDATQWGQDTVTRSLAGVEEGEIEPIVSDITLLGVQRLSEANRKALMRLRRLSYTGRFAWQAFDDGIKFQRGDVVQLPDYRGLVDVQCRIMSVDVVSPGRHQIHAEIYSPDMYPDDFIPDSTTVLPMNAILPFTGTEIPDGFTRFTEADGRYLSGASDTNPPGTLWGSASYTISGNTAPGGAHGSTNTLNGNQWLLGAPGSNPGQNLFTGGGIGNHEHEIAVSGTFNPRFRQSILIERTGGDGSIPAGAEVFADGQIIAPNLSEVTTLLGRLQRAGDGPNGGQVWPFIISGTTSSISNHGHNQGVSNGVQELTFGPRAYTYVSAGGHAHSFTISASADFRRRRLCAYLATGGAPIIPGAIVMIRGGATVPAGWYDCDGDNGTPDLRDYCIERSSSADAGQAFGDGKLRLTGSTAVAGAHSHRGSDQGNRSVSLGTHAETEGGHTHGVDLETNYHPPAYAIRFIQYTGVV